MIYPDLPERALSIMQPWPWLIFHANKRIENRVWDTKFRGRFAIHAGKKVDRDAARSLFDGRHPATGGLIDLTPPDVIHWAGGYQTGGIVGVATLAGVVYEHNSPELRTEWFVGKCGFILEDVEEVPFIPCKGALQFFKWRDYLPQT